MNYTSFPFLCFEKQYPVHHYAEHCHVMYLSALLVRLWEKNAPQESR